MAASGWLPVGLGSWTVDDGPGADMSLVATPATWHQFPVTRDFARTAGNFAIGGNVHRRIVEVSSVLLAVGLTSALGCSSAGRDAAKSDSSAPAANPSASTPAEFKLAGPFATGSRGTTLVPGQEPRHWKIREVRAGESYTVEFPLDGATMSFEWKFEGVADGGTRLTQRVMLAGKNAAAYLEQVRPAFTASLAPGMEKIAAAIGRAFDLTAS